MLNKHSNKNYQTNKVLDEALAVTNVTKDKRFYHTTFYLNNGSRYTKYQTANNLWEILVLNYENTGASHSQYKSYWTDPVPEEQYNAAMQQKQNMMNISL